MLSLQEKSAAWSFWILATGDSQKTAQMYFNPVKVRTLGM